MFKNSFFGVGGFTMKKAKKAYEAAIAAIKTSETTSTPTRTNPPVYKPTKKLNTSNKTSNVAIATITNDFLIVNSPSATLEKITNWAISKHANDCFMDVICIAYIKSIEYGLDPVLVIAQIALETGYCRFGGQVSINYHNTCGLKNKNGSGFNIFPSWDEGVEAHVQHLALYANSPKLAGKRIVDPRHFESLRGIAKTANDLSQKWATNSDYGRKLNSMCKDICK